MNPAEREKMRLEREISGAGQSFELVEQFSGVFIKIRNKKRQIKYEKVEVL